MCNARHSVHDFTSALYLGLRHEASSLRPWAQLTAGVPSALSTPADARTIARELADLTGCESATLAPSTLHIFLDLPAILGGGPATVHVENGSYPVGRWGVERALHRGVPVRWFAHHEPAALRRSLDGGNGRPLVVIDGFCPACGGPAPIGSYSELVAAYGGRLLIDDTQALGILGRRPSDSAPYGHRGGGSLRYHDVYGSHVLVVASLAKAFGVPLAVLSGDQLEISRYEAASETRVHCSPPSTVALRAAERALAVNRGWGDELRARVVRNVAHFRGGLASADIHCEGDPFPVLALEPLSAGQLAVVDRELTARNVLAVPQRTSGDEGRMCFLITARHTSAEIDATADVLRTVAPLLARPHNRIRDVVRSSEAVAMRALTIE